MAINPDTLHRPESPYDPNDPRFGYQRDHGHPQRRRAGWRATTGSDHTKTPARGRGEVIEARIEWQEQSEQQ
jgi:hypothetical protein